MSIKFVTEKKQAVRFTVDMKGDVQEYALNWLAICNNVRDRRELLKVYNDRGSYVCVIVERGAADYASDWLECFGKIVERTEVLCLVPAIDDMALTEQDYATLCEAELLSGKTEF